MITIFFGYPNISRKCIQLQRTIEITMLTKGKKLIKETKEAINRNWGWIVIKPVLILYCFQDAITQSITSQVR